MFWRESGASPSPGDGGRSARETKKRGGGSAAAASSGLASKAGELGEPVGETKVPAVIQYGSDAPTISASLGFLPALAPPATAAPPFGL